MLKKKNSEQNFLPLHVVFHAKNAHLDGAFSEFFELEASPIEAQSLQQQQNKRKKNGNNRKAQRLELILPISSQWLLQRN